MSHQLRLSFVTTHGNSAFLRLTPSLTGKTTALPHQRHAHFQRLDGNYGFLVMCALVYEVFFLGEPASNNSLKRLCNPSKR
ncbi:Caveolae-Associated Protein 3 [Manis pentadactyla]|nr:Caveolae-Associated Protein 3 [Manis pentadactyla]